MYTPASRTAFSVSVFTWQLWIRVRNSFNLPLSRSHAHRTRKHAHVAQMKAPKSDTESAWELGLLLLFGRCVNKTVTAYLYRTYLTTTMLYMPSNHVRTKRPTNLNPQIERQ